MTLVNATHGVITITDIKIAGVSVLGTVRTDLLDAGRFEDAEDLLTLLPGEQITLGGDECHWIET